MVTVKDPVLKKRILRVVASLERVADTEGVGSLRQLKSVLRRSQNLLQETINASQLGNMERAAGWAERLVSSFRDGLLLAKSVETTLGGKTLKASVRLRSLVD